MTDDATPAKVRFTDGLGLVERLRQRPTVDPYLHMLVHEAADEIERLRMDLENTRAEAVLAVAAERERIAKHFDDRDRGRGIGFYDPHEPAEIIRALGPNVGGEARLAAHQPSQTTTATPQGVASTDQLGRASEARN